MDGFCGCRRRIDEALLQELEAAVPAALENTRNAMPDDFSGAIADSIANAVMRRLRILVPRATD
jgi:hypothetical protein